jgi:acetate kinase
MADLLLVLNAGSSSIKFRAYDAAPAEPALLLQGQVEGLYNTAHFSARDADGATIGEQRWAADAAFGHQQATEYIGGFLRSHCAQHRLVLVNPEVIDALDRLTPLAPLHQPHNLAPIRILSQLRPDLPQVACFDTAFHRVQSEVAQAYALPASITRLGIRRYGFHGLSYEYIASVLPAYSAQAAAGATLVAHLGNGASLCALAGGKSVASTMGFTAVDGLPMGTRCGNIDPGVVLFLMDYLHMDTRAVEDLIYKQSGLLGVSGISSDMRTLLDSEDARARFAVDLFIYRIGRELGSLAAATGGIDALVFTAGIGEHAALIRERVCRAAHWLGVELDPAANAGGGPRLSTAASKVSAWVIPTNEERMIARHTRAVLTEAAS